MSSKTAFCGGIVSLSRAAFRALLAVVTALATAPAGAVDDDGAPLNVYMTGAEVRIDRPVEGDLVVAAGRIHIDQPVGGDAVLGAGSLDVQAPIGEDLRAAGGIVTLASRVQGEVLVAAGRIIVNPGAEIHGETWLAAANVTLAGRALSSVKVYARELTVLGEIYGPLDISADRIEIGDNARVYGDVTYSSANAIKIHPGAQIAGNVIRNPGKLEVREPAATIPGLKPLRPLLIAALFAAGVLLHALFPRFTTDAVGTLAAAPAKSLGLGTALFLSVPPVAVLLVITIIGIPIGVILAAAHGLALLGGYLVTGFFLAAKLGQTLHRPALAGWQRYVLFAGALLLLALVTSIPYVGLVVLVLALAAGLGAIVLQRFSRPPAIAPVENRDNWPSA